MSHFPKGHAGWCSRSDCPQCNDPLHPTHPDKQKEKVVIEWSMVEPGFHGGTLPNGNVYGACLEKAGHAGFEKSGWYVYPPHDEHNPVGPFKTLKKAKEHIESEVKNAGT